MIRWLAFRGSLGSNGALRRLEHDSDNVPKHRYGEQTDLLELADLAELGDAVREVGERAMPDNGAEVFLVEASHDLESRVDDAFLWKVRTIP